MQIVKFSARNEKLKKTEDKVRAAIDAGTLPIRPRGYRIASFNLPAGAYDDPDTGEHRVTCPGAGACLSLCYARQGRYLMTNVQRLRIDNHRALRAAYRSGGVPEVTATLAAGLARLPRTVGVIRIHDSGDFFSRWYLDAWLTVAQMHPRILFYAYTKSVPMIPGTLPRNMVITFSEGGIWDNQINGRPHSRIFKDQATREAAGYTEGNASDLPAVVGETRIGLVYHGTKKPDPAILDRLSRGVYAVRGAAHDVMGRLARARDSRANKGKAATLKRLSDRLADRLFGGVA